MNHWAIEVSLKPWPPLGASSPTEPLGFHGPLGVSKDPGAPRGLRIPMRSPDNDLTNFPSLNGPSPGRTDVFFYISLKLVTRSTILDGPRGRLPIGSFGIQQSFKFISFPWFFFRSRSIQGAVGGCPRAVSYTHLTLPTICSV